ncbi:hypothetical protein [Sphingobium sp.]|uniref:hypothetical protein n=1 Tax=Sphingobium sp. TaxID=1912891 RepID=UPI0035C75135
MPAAVFQDAGKPLIETLPDPASAPAQMTLEIADAGVCGTDLRLSESLNVPRGAILRRRMNSSRPVKRCAASTGKTGF